MNWRAAVRCYGIGVLAASTVVFVVGMLVASQNGWVVTYDMNPLGEGPIEAVAFALGLLPAALVVVEYANALRDGGI